MTSSAYSIGALEPDEERSVESHVAGLRALHPRAAGPRARRGRPRRVRRAARAAGGASREGARHGPRGGRAGAGARARERRPALTADPSPRRRPGGACGRGRRGRRLRDQGRRGVRRAGRGSGESESGVGGELQVSDDRGDARGDRDAQLAKGSVYQVWVDQNGAVRPASSFVPDQGGMATATVSAELESGDRVMVTQESRPGRKVPNLPPVLSASVD